MIVSTIDCCCLHVSRILNSIMILMFRVTNNCSKQRPAGFDLLFTVVIFSNGDAYR